MSPAEEAIALATSTFGPELVLAFVGGSHAAGTAHASSDVDIFVVIRKSDRSSECAFAVGLRELHRRHGLNFEHCGEVFDMETLEDLLTATHECLKRLPALQLLACYQADCLLSVFRKGDIVFKFLVDDMVCVTGDREYLSALHDRAEAYFAQYPMRRVQHHKGKLLIETGSGPSRLINTWLDRVAVSGWTDTPVGIGLGRWFSRQAIGDPPPPVQADPAGWPSPSAIACPLSANPTNTPAGAVLRWQCLASHTDPGGATS